MLKFICLPKGEVMEARSPSLEERGLNVKGDTIWLFAPF